MDKHIGDFNEEEILKFCKNNNISWTFQKLSKYPLLWKRINELGLFKDGIENLGGMELKLVGTNLKIKIDCEDLSDDELLDLINTYSIDKLVNNYKLCKILKEKNLFERFPNNYLALVKNNLKKRKRQLQRERYENSIFFDKNYSEMSDERLIKVLEANLERNSETISRMTRLSDVLKERDLFYILGKNYFRDKIAEKKKSSIIKDIDVPEVEFEKPFHEMSDLELYNAFNSLNLKGISQVEFEKKHPELFSALKKDPLLLNNLCSNEIIGEKIEEVVISDNIGTKPIPIKRLDKEGLEKKFNDLGYVGLGRYDLYKSNRTLYNRLLAFPELFDRLCPKKTKKLKIESKKLKIEFKDKNLVERRSYRARYDGNAEEFRLLFFPNYSRKEIELVNSQLFRALNNQGYWKNVPVSNPENGDINNLKNILKDYSLKELGFSSVFDRYKVERVKPSNRKIKSKITRDVKKCDNIAQRRKLIREYEREDIFAYLFNNDLFGLTRTEISRKPNLVSRLKELELLDHYFPKVVKKERVAKPKHHIVKTKPKIEEIVEVDEKEIDNYDSGLSEEKKKKERNRFDGLYLGKRYDSYTDSQIDWFETRLLMYSDSKFKLAEEKTTKIDYFGEEETNTSKLKKGLVLNGNKEGVFFDSWPKLEDDDVENPYKERYIVALKNLSSIIELQNSDFWTKIGISKKTGRKVQGYNFRHDILELLNVDIKYLEAGLKKVVNESSLEITLNRINRNNFDSEVHSKKAGALLDECYQLLTKGIHNK